MWDMTDVQTVMNLMTIALGVVAALCLLLALCGERSIDWIDKRREDKRQRREAMEWMMAMYHTNKERSYNGRY